LTGCWIAVFGGDFAGGLASGFGTAAWENVLRCQTELGGEFTHFGHGVRDFALASSRNGLLEGFTLLQQVFVALGHGHSSVEIKDE
jgi:hypothetical protein